MSVSDQSTIEPWCDHCGGHDLKEKPVPSSSSASTVQDLFNRRIPQSFVALCEAKDKPRAAEAMRMEAKF